MEGKERMRKKEYSNIGGTAARVTQGITATQEMDFIRTIKKTMTHQGKACIMEAAGLDPSRPQRIFLRAIAKNIQFVSFLLPNDT